MTAEGLQRCPFCAISDADAVHANGLAIVRRDGFPVSPGHSLVIPRRHVSSYFELTREERLAVVDLLDTAKREVDAKHAPQGYNIGINDGAAAGQTVMHLHVHLIPRYLGDRNDPRGGVRWIFTEKAAYWKADE
jgi:diadenosine tetraphosphate (Ap4A) HIT family hydrolase